MPIPTGDAALLFADDLEAIAPALGPSSRSRGAGPSSGAGASSSDGLSREERERLIERARLRQAERSRVAIAETEGGPASGGRRSGRRRDDGEGLQHAGLAGLRPQLDARRPHTSEEVGRLVERLVHQELTRDEPSTAPHEAPRSPLPSNAQNQQLVVGRLVSLHERLAARAAARIEAERESATDASSADERGGVSTARRRRRRRRDGEAVGSAAVWMRRHPTGDADMRIRHDGAAIELRGSSRMIFSELAMQESPRYLGAISHRCAPHRRCATSSCHATLPTTRWFIRRRANTTSVTATGRRSTTTPSSTQAARRDRDLGRSRRDLPRRDRDLGRSRRDLPDEIAISARPHHHQQQCTRAASRRKCGAAARRQRCICARAACLRAHPPRAFPWVGRRRAMMSPGGSTGSLATRRLRLTCYRHALIP